MDEKQFQSLLTLIDSYTAISIRETNLHKVTKKLTNEFNSSLKNVKPLFTDEQYDTLVSKLNE